MTTQSSPPSSCRCGNNTLPAPAARRTARHLGHRLANTDTTTCLPPLSTQHTCLSALYRCGKPCCMNKYRNFAVISTQTSGRLLPLNFPGWWRSDLPLAELTVWVRRRLPCGGDDGGGALRIHTHTYTVLVSCCRDNRVESSFLCSATGCISHECSSSLQPAAREETSGEAVRPPDDAA